MSEERETVTLAGCPMGDCPSIKLAGCDFGASCPEIIQRGGKIIVTGIDLKGDGVTESAVEITQELFEEAAAALLGKDKRYCEAEKDAMGHLGNVLNVFADLHEDHRCRAFEEALEFYNRQNPDARIEGEPGFTQRLCLESPLGLNCHAAPQSSAQALPGDQTRTEGDA